MFGPLALAATADPNTAVNSAENHAYITVKDCDGADLQVRQREADMLVLHNEYRAERQLPQLCIDPKLTQAARDHAVESADNNRVSHTSLDGRTATQRVNATGYCAQSDYIGENAQGDAGQTTSRQNFGRWIASDGHRANIEDKYFTEVGIGSAYVANTEDDPMIGWVVVFAEPCITPTDPGTGDVPIEGDAPLAKPVPNAKPTISAKTKMTTRASRPVVSAIVRDRDSNLLRSNITVKLDGRVARKGIRYSTSTDKLTVKPSKPLKDGWHKVFITARDGRGGVASKTVAIRVR